MKSSANLIRVGALVITLLLPTALPGSARAAGTPGAGDGDLAGGAPADEAAVAFYESGLAHKLSAREKESLAASAGTEAERERLLAEAKALYQDAATAQGKALKLQLNYYQAANELGYALRKSGEHRKALGAYNFALGIKPDFYPAVEYRGEACLALGMLNEAREAYMLLFRNDLTLAAELLSAMDAAPVADPGFTAWVEERKALAARTPADGSSTADW